MPTVEDLLSQNSSGIPIEIYNLTDLKKLDVSSRQIKVGEYENAEGTGTNTFDEIEKDITRLTNLEELNLSNNEINEIPEYLTTLTTLKKLDLSYNNIQKIPKSLKNLTNLEELILKNNPVSNIKGLNHKKSPEEIINFLLFNQNKEMIPLNEAKILVLGDENAGKTSLVKRIIHTNQPYVFTQDYSSTEGIDIKEHFFDNIKVKFWDFAGQEITYQVHNLFMSQESLYLLVVDGQKEDDISNHFNWIETINSNADKPPIIIVVTKHENNRTYKLDEELYCNEFSNIVGVCYVSSKENTGFDKLKSLIREEINKLSNMNFPKEYIKVKEEIEGKEDDYILEPSEFKNICKNKGGFVSNEERANIRKILTDIGTIIGLDKDERHIVYPDTIIDDIYEIIRSGDVNDKGEMPIEDNDNKDYNWIIEFLIKNKIAFKVNESTVMIPSRLPVNRPIDFSQRVYEGIKENDEDFKQGLNYRYRYIQGFKRGILFNFIIQMQEHIKKYHPKYWANGVCWEQDGVKVAVLLNRIYKTIDIHIPTCNEKSRILLTTIRDEFAKINKDDTSIFVIEEIAIFKDDEIKKYVSYNFLKYKKDNGDKDVEIEIHQGPYIYNISELIDRYERAEEKEEDTTKPLIFTEGKTDWKHLKKALERFKQNGLYANLDIKFEEYEYDMGDANLDRMVESYRKTQQAKKYIFMFDRDNDKYIKKYGKEVFNNHGNNVYSFCIPKISSKLDKICIEFYYNKDDLKTEDENGRRLFLGDEFFVNANGNSKCKKFQTRLQNKAGKALEIIDSGVYKRDDLEMKNSIALSKNDFAENILNDIEGFNNFNIENFKLIFDVIDKIVHKDKYKEEALKIINNYNKNHVKVIQVMQSGAIKNFENIKVELAKELRKLMQQSARTWGNAKGKVLKRKEYIEKILKGDI